MTTQTTYSERMGAARVGMIANTEPVTLISRNVETVAGIGFGLPVARGAADDGIKAVEAGVTDILGITVREHSTNANNPDVFARYDSARVMTKGVIWVQASLAVNDGDPVWVTVATGAFVKADAGSGASARVLNAVYDSTTSGAGLAKVRMA